ncbi:MAG: alpha/beta hydrolase family protein [Pyrinomonadaceae bacterium]
MRLKLNTYVVIVAVLAVSIFDLSAQTGTPGITKAVAPGTAQYQTLRLKSKLMNREMPYRVVLPTAYGDSGETPRFPVVYLLHGLTGHFDNWTNRTKLVDYALPGNVIIVTPEGDNGWYSDSITVATDKYESYIVKELIPEIDKLYRTSAKRENRFIAGLSMGGYGSVKFGLKYPEMFSLVGSFSGALGATSFTEKTAGNIGKGVDLIFGADDSELRKSNDVFRLIREMPADKKKTLPFVYQSCGTEDFLFQNNRDFVALLAEKQVPHEYRQRPGAHDWKFWDLEIQEFLRLVERRIKK